MLLQQKCAMQSNPPARWLTVIRGAIVLDTNAAIALLNGSTAALREVERYDAVYLPATAVGELRFGAYRSERKSENLVRVDALEMRCAVLEVDSATADHYGRLRAQLFSAGTPLPENDIWIAASALNVDAPLLTGDAHFRHVPKLKVVWMKEHK
jgi:tRNA(fMet)-specific endonuclease VapC